MKVVVDLLGYTPLSFSDSITIALKCQLLSFPALIDQSKLRKNIQTD